MKQYNYIYLITNKLNGKIYIGQHHSNKLNDKYFGSGKLILKAFQKYGKENFTKEILAYADTQEKLDYLERFYIRKYNSADINIGYNLAKGGQGAYGYGHPHTEEFKKTMSERMRGTNNPFYGKHHTEESKKNIGANNHSSRFGGHYHNEEERKRISDSLKKTYSDPAVRKKLSDAHKNKQPACTGKHRVYDDLEHKKYHFE